MKAIMTLAAPVLLVASNAAAAQALPSTHEQHQAAAQHQAKAGEDRCCCEPMMQEMRKMMTDMMRMHQGMAAHPSRDTTEGEPQQKR